MWKSRDASVSLSSSLMSSWRLKIPLGFLVLRKSHAFGEKKKWKVMICSSLWFSLETFFSTLTSHKKDEFYQIFMTNVTQHFAQTSSMNKPFSLFWSPWAHPEHTLSTLKDCSEITQTTLITNSESTQRTLGEHSLHLNGVHSCSKTSFFLLMIVLSAVR